MTTKKAIKVQLAVFVALLPCMLVLNDNESTWCFNVFGLLYVVLLVRWIVSTPAGRNALKSAEKSNKVLFSVSAEE